MKERKEIEKDALKLEIPPKNYNLLELHCFLALKQLLIMYWNKQISAKNAGRIKQQIFANYEKYCKEFDFWVSVFEEKVEASNRTAYSRNELRKKWKSNEEVTSEKLAEMLNMALEIISITYKEEF